MKVICIKDVGFYKTRQIYVGGVYSVKDKIFKVSGRELYYLIEENDYYDTMYFITIDIHRNNTINKLLEND